MAVTKYSVVAVTKAPPAGRGFEALHSMAQRVMTPVGDEGAAARQVVCQVVPAVTVTDTCDELADDITRDNFNWARVDKILILDPDGLSRICNLCGLTKNGRAIKMAVPQVDGDINVKN